MTREPELLLCAILACLAPVACDSAQAQRARLGSGNPVERAAAVVGVEQRADSQAIPKLVDLLEDPDSAVRLYAIVALRRETGQDYGYRYYAPETERAGAVARWRAALRTGAVRVRPAGAPGPTTAPAANAPAHAAIADGGARP